MPVASCLRACFKEVRVAITIRREKYPPGNAGQDFVHRCGTGTARSLATNANKIAFMMWLSTLACSTTETTDITVLQVLALSFTRPDISRLQLQPLCDSYRLALGKTVDKAEVQAAVASKLNFKTSPEARLVRCQNEKKTSYEKRCDQAFRSVTNPIVASIVDRLTAQWPCEIPTAATLSSVSNTSTYLNIEMVLAKVRPKFSTWFYNLQFFRYLKSIDRIVSALPLIPMQVPNPWLVYTSRIPTRTVRHVTRQALFASEGPAVLASTTCNIGQNWIDSSSDPSSGTMRLSALIAQIRASGGNSVYENAYVPDLEASALELQKARSHHHLITHDRIHLDLADHLETCVNQVAHIYSMLSSAVLPGSGPHLDRGTALCSVYQWPRISPVFFVQHLKRSRWSLLNKAWQHAIVEYGLALTALQRAERLVSVSRSGSDVDMISELRNTAHVNWSPIEYPDSLLLEVESGILVREVQEQIAGQMRDPGGNTVMQLNMGKGKSSIIAPIVAAALADGSQLVRVVVAKPQSKQMAQMMISKLGGLLDRRVYYMSFCRTIKTSAAAVSAINSMLHECMLEGGILLVQPEHILSFKLMALEVGIRGEHRDSQSLLRMQDFFNDSSRDVVYESDENFSVKFELIYTMGTHRAVDMSTERWLCIHEILDLMRKFSQSTADKLPGSVHCLPRTRILKPDAEDHLFGVIASHNCNTGLRGFSIARQSQAVGDAVLTYITKVNLTQQEIDTVEHGGAGSLWIDSTKSILLLLRGLFAAGVLSFVFAQKRWRVNYGLHDTRKPPTKLAVPFRAKDMPSPRSEFSHPDVIIMLTTLSYYYGGLSEDNLAAAFEHLSRSDHADTEYDLWVQDAHGMPTAFAQLEGINLRDKHQFTTQLLMPAKICSAG
ncbi:hypothetical protein LTR54_017496 [Friedmanniomyces endolithicus]|nr:hypothetical protein LTR54_017496 [Friedmanniomyces endolithicus]